MGHGPQERPAPRYPLACQRFLGIPENNTYLLLFSLAEFFLKPLDTLLSEIDAGGHPAGPLGNTTASASAPCSRAYHPAAVAPVLAAQVDNAP
jgi:hypothetical protein